MTYGWAILIIAVVLGALFQLGVFNATNFAPRVPAGACQVERLSTQVALAGECQGGLPQYVAVFNGAANITGSFSTGFPYNSPASITLTAWIYDPTNSGIAALAAGSSSYGCSTHLYEAGLTSFSSNDITYHGCCLDQTPGPFSNFNRADGKWHFIAISISSSAQYIFDVDNNFQSGSGGITPNLGGQFILMGQDECDHWRFTGEEANLQLYNTSLSENDLTALYLEGIGGAPIDVQNIVGWWPLNGNTNDYSGNGNSGTATGVTYTGSYLSSYTPP